MSEIEDSARHRKKLIRSVISPEDSRQMPIEENSSQGSLSPSTEEDWGANFMWRIVFFYTTFALVAAGQLFGQSNAATIETFPRFELAAETGVSLLTSASGPRQSITVPLSNGQVQNVVLTTRSSFSKAGRVLAGVRFRMTEKNALEFSWSYSPNRYELTGTVNPPVATVVPDQVTQSLHQGALNYVRYVPNSGRIQPFITGGIGLSRFVGMDGNVSRFTGNFGAGLDVPIRKRIALRIQFRDFVSGQPCPVGGVTHNLTPTAGLVFKLH